MLGFQEGCVRHLMLKRQANRPQSLVISFSHDLAINRSGPTSAMSALRGRDGSAGSMRSTPARPGPAG